MAPRKGGGFLTPHRFFSLVEGPLAVDAWGSDEPPHPRRWDLVSAPSTFPPPRRRHLKCRLEGVLGFSRAPRIGGLGETSGCSPAAPSRGHAGADVHRSISEHGLTLGASATPPGLNANSFGPTASFGSRVDMWSCPHVAGTPEGASHRRSGGDSKRPRLEVWTDVTPRLVGSAFSPVVAGFRGRDETGQRAADSLAPGQAANLVDRWPCRCAERPRPLVYADDAADDHPATAWVAHPRRRSSWKRWALRTASERIESTRGGTSPGCPLRGGRGGTSGISSSQPNAGSQSSRVGDAR